MTQVVWFWEEKERKVLFAGVLFVCLFSPPKRILLVMLTP